MAARIATALELRREGDEDDGNEGGGDIRAGAAAASICAKAAAGRTASAMPATASITAADATGRARHGGNGREGNRDANGSISPNRQPDEPARSGAGQPPTRPSRPIPAS